MTRRGFTLIEAMVATLVFAVGMMAVITMEFSSLRAYGASKDLSVATDLSERTISLMQVEGGNWAQKGKLSVVDPAMVKPVMLASDTNSPIQINMLNAIITQPWVWQMATPEPVTERMSVSGELGRYCVFVRGGASQLALGGETANVDVGGMPTAVDITPLIQAQVAVVYPSGEESYPDESCEQVSCGASPANTIDLLDPQGVALGAVPPLEACGWRAVYSGVLINR